MEAGRPAGGVCGETGAGGQEKITGAAFYGRGAVVWAGGVYRDG